MKLVLDTSVLIADDPIPPGVPVAVASVTYAELAFGVRTAADSSERAVRQARIARVRKRLGPGLPFDDETADAYGIFTGMVLAAGASPRARFLDLMIAATAYVAGAGVHTRNPVDFAPVAALVPISTP